MFYRQIITVVVTLLIFVPSAIGLEIGGINLPDTLTVDKDSLVLNGAGLRKKLFFKVYAGALYLKKKNQNDDQIIKADEPMAIRMHFIYDGVSSEKLIKAWNEGFERGLGSDMASLKNKIDKFNGLFTEEAKKDHIYDIIYRPQKGVSVVINGKVKGVIQGFDFKKAVFSIWLGNNTALPNLKSKMLGN